MLRTLALRPARGFGRLGNRRGAATVEFAFVAPIFFLLLFGIFEYGRFIFYQHVLSNAAREGSRYAATNTFKGTDAELTNVINTKCANLQNRMANFTVRSFRADPLTGNAAGNGNVADQTPGVGAHWKTAEFGEPIAVRITATYTPTVPRLLFLQNTIQMVAQTMANSEAN